MSKKIQFLDQQRRSIWHLNVKTKNWTFRCIKICSRISVRNKLDCVIKKKEWKTFHLILEISILSRAWEGKEDDPSYSQITVAPYTKENLEHIFILHIRENIIPPFHRFSPWTEAQRRRKRVFIILEPARNTSDKGNAHKSPRSDITVKRFQTYRNHFI